LKREIVAATLAPGSSVSLVARRYDVNANQVFAWRRHYRGAAAVPAGLQLMPVTVMPDQPVGTAPAGASELIEIVFAGYYRDAGGHSAPVEGDSSTSARSSPAAPARRSARRRRRST
jgi:transposase